MKSLSPLFVYGQRLLEGSGPYVSVSFKAWNPRWVGSYPTWVSILQDVPHYRPRVASSHGSPRLVYISHIAKHSCWEGGWQTEGGVHLVIYFLSARRQFGACSFSRLDDEAPVRVAFFSPFQSSLQYYISSLEYIWNFFKVGTSSKLTVFSVEIAQTWGFCWFYHPLNGFWKRLDRFVDLSILIFVHKAIALPTVLWGNCWGKTVVSLMARLILLVGLSMELRFAESHVTFQALFMIWL